MRGSSWIDLPTYLKSKHAIINMQNKDNKCFLCCVLRALHLYKKNEKGKYIKNEKGKYIQVSHPERIYYLKSKFDILNTTGIEYPVSLKDIDKFEKQNPTISITVFGYNEKDKVYPLRNSNNTDREHKIRLMLIEKDGVLHYCLVNNQSRLLSLQVSKHNGENIFVIGV